MLSALDSRISWRPDERTRFFNLSDFLEVEAPDQKRMRLTVFLMINRGEVEIFEKTRSLRAFHRTQLTVGKQTPHRRRTEAWIEWLEQIAKQSSMLDGRKPIPSLRRKGAQTCCARLHDRKR